MRLHYLLFVFLILFLVPAPGDAFLPKTLRKFFCRIRGGRCAVLNCLGKEEQIGRCSNSGRKCCRKKK
ncbi:beta-defensin 14 isoform X1 [Mus musculus]|uniref:Beta-defensin 14 n=2 Tax=Mus TaxID=862507 RepID=DFB14_MOUSE|nr:beta-defensin 14 precursor [Mus musculus]XP_006508855.1 beta-defensin 14 isoform X1 [Mus musculus]XP_006508857.1 beta-defensin 14 isoform X1 [Mus musculus]XP_006508858.1 beta-defensin 14 isoform X1 [Mus musculus]XP_006508860.1 beta-defensin 14 isoform X1 [Mus musculus]Q7TNV9.1 RecName: Full=Beta-defensin 14; Short=BD-14; Short=mBD-14; AltName: Full=Defensin, beta 14; Flags: Precursor [Mus musculus]AAI16200.1 Defensin beta 14 [Mus musculus]EDL22231.1 defensin beta 14 [Mus musculus]CAE1766|eukprot:NP_898847.1 beta-defensin 14 precursor [Mus musculus]